MMFEPPPGLPAAGTLPYRETAGPGALESSGRVAPAEAAPLQRTYSDPGSLNSLTSNLDGAPKQVSAGAYMGACSDGVLSACGCFTYQPWHPLSPPFPAQARSSLRPCLCYLSPELITDPVTNTRCAALFRVDLGILEAGKRASFGARFADIEGGGGGENGGV